MRFIIVLLCIVAMSERVSGQYGKSYKVERYIEARRSNDTNRRYREYNREQWDSIRRDRKQFAFIRTMRIFNDTLQVRFAMQNPSLAPWNYSRKGNFCGNKKHLRKKEIGSLSPFNRTVSVELVSFITPDSLEMQLPMRDGQVDLDRLHERKMLTREQQWALFDVLVNYDDTGNEYSDAYFCNEPRNGILFMDDSGRVINYIELCFGCHKVKVGPGYTSAGIFYCNEKFEVLRWMFKDAGVEYGVLSDYDY